MSTDFDYARFLTYNFRDADGLLGIVGKHFVKTPNREAVRKWFTRSTVPSDWLPTLLSAIEAENGSPANINSYFKDRNDDEDIFA